MGIAVIVWMLAAAGAAETAPTPLPVASRHLALEHDARTVHAVRWRDRLGDHTLLLDETGALDPVDPSPGDEDSRHASVFAYEYLEAGGSTKRVWKLEDHVGACPVDLWAAFVPGSVTITDLDHDGEAEVTFQYTLACRGGMDPASRKLILREGADKYAIRGTDRHPAYDPQYVTREPDPAFARAPPAFLKHALAQWEAFVDVSPGQF
jgi:hypothetical protein